MSPIAPSPILSAAFIGAVNDGRLYHDLSADERGSLDALSALLLDEVKAIGRPNLTAERAQALAEWFSALAHANGVELEGAQVAVWIHQAANLVSVVGVQF